MTSKQLSLPGAIPTDQIVNVASVPHRSVFRYPGGKTWLVPRIRQWLSTLSYKPANFIEPFAGGAIVGLTIAFEKLADHVTLVELDRQIGAVWQAIIEEGQGEWLARQIEQFELTYDNVTELLAQENLPVRDQAFQTIVHNRVSRGGIIAKGAGLIKHGENGKGLASRWYPKTLAKRIRAIDMVRERLTFVCADGLQVIRQVQERPDVAFFVDPPYTAGTGKRAGRRLYTHSQLDHQQLFTLMESVQGSFVMTYDNDPAVRDLASRHGLDACPIAMKSTHHAKMTELIISADISWICPSQKESHRLSL